MSIGKFLTKRLRAMFFFFLKKRADAGENVSNFWIVFSCLKRDNSFLMLSQDVDLQKKKKKKKGQGWRKKAGLSDSHKGGGHIKSNTVVVAHGMYRHIQV